MVAVLVGAGLLVFLWGIVRMLYGMGVTDTEQQKAREEGKKRIMWGLLGLVVLVSIWGIVAVITDMIGATPPGGNDYDTPVINW